MYILGFSGGPATMAERELDMNAQSLSHDGAVVLIKDGQVVAAVEEERLNRVKHSNLFPSEGAKFCLEKAGISILDVSKIAFYLNESYLDGLLKEVHDSRGQSGQPLRARDVLGGRLHQLFGVDVRDKCHFVDHHVAHAYSAFPYSGVDESLVLIMDAMGESTSGLIGRAKNGNFEKLCDLREEQSLGRLYGRVIRFMGLGMFDEYKAMGLAPYGNPAVFRSLFQELYVLKDGGQFELASRDRLIAVLAPQVPIARSSDELEQCHRDLAAALQEALETIVFHILRHWQTVTGLEHLSLAGGVAHNCTMNGKILASGMFKSVFVQPAAHDAGCALGAAIHAALTQDPTLSIKPFGSVYWGPSIPGNDGIRDILEQWSDWLEYRQSTDIVGETADCLASGDVIGWVQGASEFGPRALGNRSIIADPRPAENRQRINFMIKKREGFRPFAPSVTQEAASVYFELAGAPALPFMSFVVGVRPEHRSALGAITHVDGTARVQTVSESANPRYWKLLNAMGDRIGIPMVLNTSFNNNVEPVVDSVEDAICCYLTTGLDKLVIGDFIITNRNGAFNQKLRGVRIDLEPHAVLESVEGAPDSFVVRSTLIMTKLKIHQETHAFLLDSSPKKASAISAVVSDDIRALWEKRLIRLRPRVEESKQVC